MIPALVIAAAVKEKADREEISVETGPDSEMRLKVREPTRAADGSLTSKVKGTVRVTPHRRRATR